MLCCRRAQLLFTCLQNYIHLKDLSKLQTARAVRLVELDQGNSRLFGRYSLNHPDELQISDAMIQALEQTKSPVIFFLLSITLAHEFVHFAIRDSNPGVEMNSPTEVLEPIECSDSGFAFEKYIFYGMRLGACGIVLQLQESWAGRLWRKIRKKKRIQKTWFSNIDKFNRCSKFLTNDTFSLQLLPEYIAEVFESGNFVSKRHPSKSQQNWIHLGKKFS
jgi:hypothetical protein